MVTKAPHGLTESGAFSSAVRDTEFYQGSEKQPRRTLLNQLAPPRQSVGFAGRSKAGAFAFHPLLFGFEQYVDLHDQTHFRSPGPELIVHPFARLAVLGRMQCFRRKKANRGREVTNVTS